MSLISASVPNLVNGISQQPYALRLTSQAEAQCNGLSSVSDGLMKRPPLYHVARILGQAIGEAYIHTINRDAAERYVVVIQTDGLRVFRLDGTEVAVNAPQGFTYLHVGDPQNNVSAFTEADYTFIVNKGLVVQPSASLTPARPPEGLVWVKQGAYSTAYSIFINGVPFTYTTPSAATADNAAFISTSYIAAQLANAMHPVLDADWVIEDVGGGVYITPRSGVGDFTLETTDGIANQGLQAVKDFVQSFDKLPAKGVDGFVVGVKDVTEGSTAEYYVRYDSSKRVWTEAPKGNEADQIDPTTMPHVLVREANGTFTFRQADWDKRVVGDLDTVPMPSFVGKTVNDIFFFKNRLGILADENVILSRSGEFFAFFRATAIQTLDTDVIDIAGTGAQVSTLKCAVPFNEALLLFSDQCQFELGKVDGVLSPKTVSMALMTAFEANLTAKPVGAGQNVYFVTANGSFSGMREYYVDVDTRLNDATEVTAHVPAYLPANVRRLAASTVQNMVLALSSNDPSRLYVYRFYWTGQTKLQSSWSKWDFGSDATILDVSFIENNIWLLVSRADGVTLERIDLQPQARDQNLGFCVHLDRRFDHTQVAPAYDAAANVTRITLPYQPAAQSTCVLVGLGAAGDAYKAGASPSFTQAGTVLTVPGRLTQFVCGVEYEFRYRLSTIINRVPSKSGSGTEAILDGRLQLHYLMVNYANTGYFAVEVAPKFRDVSTSVFSGRIIGSGDNVVGALPLATGNFKVPLRSKNDQLTIDLVSSSFQPCSFMSAEWTGDFILRSQRN